MTRMPETTRLIAAIPATPRVIDLQNIVEGAQHRVRADNGNVLFAVVQFLHALGYVGLDRLHLVVILHLQHDPEHAVYVEYRLGRGYRNKNRFAEICAKGVTGAVSTPMTRKR